MHRHQNISEKYHQSNWIFTSQGNDFSCLFCFFNSANWLSKLIWKKSFNANLYFQLTWLFWILMTLEFLYFVLYVCSFFSNKKWGMHKMNMKGLFFEQVEMPLKFQQLKKRTTYLFSSFIFKLSEQWTNCSFLLFCAILPYLRRQLKYLAWTNIFLIIKNIPG